MNSTPTGWTDAVDLAKNLPLATSGATHS